MPELSNEEQGIPSGLLELKTMLSQRLAAPFPESHEEKVRMLENHLREVTTVLETLPADGFTGTTEQMILFAHQVADNLRKQSKQTSSVLYDSDCDAAAAAGVGLITVGAMAGGKGGAVAGFGVALIVLTTFCVGA